MNRVPRILFVAEAVSLAHVIRPLVLARWARAAGYDCVFACGNQSLFSKVLEQGTIPLKILPTLHSETFYSRIAQGDFFYTGDELKRYLVHDRRLIATTRPNLIVSDFRLTMNLAATLEGIPQLTLSNAHWNPEAFCPFDVPLNSFGARVPERVRRLLLNLLRPLIFKRFGSVLDDLRCLNGLTRVRDFRRHYTTSGLDPRREHCAYLDHPDFGPPACLPPGHFFLGPILWHPSASLSTPFAQSSTKAPLIYITLGGSGTRDMLSKVLAALRPQKVRMVISGVAETEISKLLAGMPELNGRVRAGKLIDPAPILRQACMTICHGGSGTVYQSLAHGVPVLCLPDHPDQEMVSKAAQTRGLGLSLSLNQRGPRTIAKGYRRLVDEACGSRAEKFSRVLRRWNTGTHWLAYLESRLGRRPVPPAHLPKPNSLNMFRSLSAHASR